MSALPNSVSSPCLCWFVLSRPKRPLLTSAALRLNADVVGEQARLASGMFYVRLCSFLVHRRIIQTGDRQLVLSSASVGKFSSLSLFVLRASSTDRFAVL